MLSKTVVLNDECSVTKNELSDDTNVTSGAVCKASGPVFTTRFVYNSNANPALVAAALARTKQSSQKFFCQVRSRNFWASNSKGGKKVGNSQSGLLQDTHSQENVKSSVTVDASENDLERIEGQAGTSQGVVSHLGCQMDEKGSGHSQVVPGVKNDSPLHTGSTDCTGPANVNERVRTTKQADTVGSDAISLAKPIYDVNYHGFEDKFATEIICTKLKNNKKEWGHIQAPIFHLWRQQVDFTFGFVPLQEQILPPDNSPECGFSGSPLQIHEIVKSTGKPNFLQARIPIKSQLNVQHWEKVLAGYWDRQLLELIKFGFPLDFNRACELGQYSGNHSSANDFPNDIEAYINEELSYGALLGPFEQNPIKGGHCSPFMTRTKPNSDRRRVIVDLSWPQGASVNAGIDKSTYLTSNFDLTFPTVDDITSELKRLGRGALLYKVDVSRAFRHVKVDPGDYDLMGLHWKGHYVDSCVAFGTRHGSQIFQRLSDAVRFVMRQKGYAVIDYIDDYVGVGIPSVASASYVTLLDLMSDLGLTVSEKKLVAPSTRVTCLGVMIDSIAGTIAIPPEKLEEINSTVRSWLGKSVVSKRQLQSILGLLLYVHKCVRPARVFLNRMLELLRSSHATQRITLTSEFKRDLNWFATFLPKYNGISLYDHRPLIWRCILTPVWQVLEAGVVSLYIISPLLVVLGIGQLSTLRWWTYS